MGVNKLKGQVCLQFPAHSAQHQLHFDAVADDDAQQVVDVAGLDEGGGGEVRLVPHLAQGRIEAKAAGAGAILNMLSNEVLNSTQEMKKKVESTKIHLHSISTCIRNLKQSSSVLIFKLKTVSLYFIARTYLYC